MLKRWTALCLCLVLLVAGVGCDDKGGDTSSGTAPVRTLRYGCEPQSLVPDMTSSYALTDGENVFYKRLSDGALYRADADFQNPVKLADGEITGLNYMDGVLYFAAVTGEGEEQKSRIVSIGTDGKNETVLYELTGAVSQLLLVNDLLYFVHKHGEASDLVRCNTKGENVSTVIGGEYTVDNYAVNATKIYFTGNYQPNVEEAYNQIPDDYFLYSVFESDISGGGVAVTPFQRGENLFFYNGQLYSMLFYAASGFLMEELDPEAYTNELAFNEANGGFFWSMWLQDNQMYFCGKKERSVRCLDLATRETKRLYDANNEDNVYFTGLCVVGDQILAVDSNNVQYVSPLGDTLTFQPLA